MLSKITLLHVEWGTAGEDIQPARQRSVVFWAEMNTAEILSAIDEEISRLTQVRSLLGGLDTAAVVPERLTPSTARRRGRPKGSKNKATSFDPSEFSLPKRRTMSPEGKARIAAAQRARWARQHAEAVVPRAQKKFAAGPAARVNPPSKSSSKVSSVPKRPMTAVKSAGTKPAHAKKPNQVKAAPAKSDTQSRTARKKASKIPAESKAVKRATLKSPQPKSTRPRTAPRKTPPSSKTTSQTATPPGGTTEAVASAE